MTDSPALADALVARLRHHGVDTIYGIGGTHTLQLLGAIERCESIRYISARTELGAAYMAVGHARATGRPAVALTSTGPGALNIAAALQDASWSTLPLLHLTTSIGDDHFAGHVHETPVQHEILRLAGKACFGVRGGDVETAVDRAVQCTMSHPRGPATLEVPAGTWNEPASRASADCSPRPEHRGPVPVDAMVRTLEESARPLLFVGGGAVRDDDGSAALRLAETLQAPVITSYQGRTIANWHHPLYLGPWASEDSVRALAADADVAVVLGSKLSALGTAGWQLPLPEATFQVDLADRPHGRYPNLQRIAHDVASVVAELQGRLAPREGWAVQAVQHIRSEVPADARERGASEMDFVDAVGTPALLSVDMTKAGFWLMKYLPAAPGAVHAFSSYLTMGTALPMAAGMAVARSEPTLAVLGDGALQMSLSELATVAEYRLPVTMIVIVDGAYGMLRDNSAAVGGSTSTGLDLWNPSYPELARAFGIRCEDVESHAQLARRLAEPDPEPRMLLVRNDFKRSW